MSNRVATKEVPESTRILARMKATELTGEALRAVRHPSTASTLLSTGSLMDDEDD